MDFRGSQLQGCGCGLVGAKLFHWGSPVDGDHDGDNGDGEGDDDVDDIDDDDEQTTAVPDINPLLDARLLFEDL